MWKLVLVASLSMSLLLAETPEEKGLRIAREIDTANNGFQGEQADLKMVLINAHGDSTERKLTNMIKEKPGDGDLSMITFHWPADVKDTRMLTWSHKTGDDDQWLYLPALKRVKRINSRNKSGAFMGSEFSYEDLGSQEVEEYSYLFIEETTLDGRAVWVIERDPVSKRSGYSKEVVWFDKEYMNPLRVDYYDRKGSLLKKGVFANYVKLDQWWRVGKITMENVQTKKKSILEFGDRKLHDNFTDEQFSSDYLAED